MLDIRYIYLLHLRGTGRYKIGISRNPAARRSSIDRDIPKRRVRILFYRRVVYPREIELRLKRRFKKKQAPLKNVGPAAGKTEWFRLSPIDRITVKLILTYYNLIYWIFVLTIAVCMIDIIIVFLRL